jgi:hypothetical protein
MDGGQNTLSNSRQGTHPLAMMNSTSLATDSGVSGGRYDSASYLVLVNGFQVWRHTPWMSSASGTRNSGHETLDADSHLHAVRSEAVGCSPCPARWACGQQPPLGKPCRRLRPLAGGAGNGDDQAGGGRVGEHILEHGHGSG